MHFNYQGASHTFSSNDVNLVDYLYSYILRVHSSSSSILVPQLKTSSVHGCYLRWSFQIFGGGSTSLPSLDLTMPPTESRKHTCSFPYLRCPRRGHWEACISCGRMPLLHSCCHRPSRRSWCGRSNASLSAHLSPPSPVLLLLHCIGTSKQLVQVTYCIRPEQVTYCNAKLQMVEFAPQNRWNFGGEERELPEGEESVV